MRKTYHCYGSPEIHLDVLKSICGDTSGKSMVDLCCGYAPQTRKLGFSEKLYVDVVYRDLQESDGRFLNQDVFYFLNNCSGHHWDVSISLDSAEHFTKERAMVLLAGMHLISHRQIVFTPLGDYLIEQVSTDNPDSHKCGFLPKEFEDMGWATIVFINFHETLGIGAFFAIKCNNLEQEFERIITELNNKEWAKT